MYKHADNIHLNVVGILHTLWHIIFSCWRVDPCQKTWMFRITFQPYAQNVPKLNFMRNYEIFTSHRDEPYGLKITLAKSQILNYRRLGKLQPTLI